MSKSGNFTKEQLKFLMSICKSNLDLLNDRSTKKDVVMKKSKFWQDTEASFNASYADQPRSWKQLKKCYENNISSVRSLVREDNNSGRATGGGEGTYDLSETEEMIAGSLVKQTPSVLFGIQGTVVGNCFVSSVMFWLILRKM